MIYKFSFFVGAAISSFIDNGLSFSWERTKKQYKRTMYFNEDISRLNKDFFNKINNLKKDEAILFYNIDTHLDISYQFYLYTKNDFWSFIKLEDTKTNYQYIPINDTNFEEKMILLETQGIKKYIVKTKNIHEIIASKKLNCSNLQNIVDFRQYISSHLFNSPYKAEI